MFKHWQARLGEQLGLSVLLLDPTLAFAQQAQQIATADIIVSTPKTWEQATRRWRSRKVLHQVTLAIFDYLQLLSPEYEVVIARTKLMQQELQNTV